MTVRNPAVFLQAGAHPAEDVRRALEMLAGGAGVYDAAGGALAVSESGVPAMSVSVAGGRCVIVGDEGTYQGAYFCENRGVETVTITAADVSDPRIDLIVAKVQDSNYSGATDAWSLVAVAGTPAATPAAPTAPDNSITLATVAVAAAASSILDANITDQRTEFPVPYTAGGDPVSIADGGTGATTAAAARAALDLEVGTDVQAYSSVLAATTASFTAADETKLDAIEAGADVTDVVNVTAAGALMDSEVDADIKTLSLPANTTISAFAQTFLDDADAAAVRSTIEITEPTAFAQTFLDDADAAAVRTTLAAQGSTIVDAGSYIDATTVDGALQEAFSGQYGRNRVASSGSSETLTLHPAQYITLSANCTFTFPSVTTQGHTFLLRLDGAFTPTFPGSVDWADNVTPTYSGTALYVFTTFDSGSNWLGSYVGGGFA